MATDTSKSEARNTWDAAAPGWARWEHVVSECLYGATETLLDMAGIGPGMRVLDVACGAGSQSIQAAQRVGPDGGVTASDISATMLEHVRENAARAGLQNVETVESAAEGLHALQTAFDASICRMGLMLFPSPRQALAAVQGALKPSARFAALVFTTPANNPFMAQPLAILLRIAGKSPPAPGQPGLFALGGDGVLEGLLRDSGLLDVNTRTMGATLKLPSASEALEMMQQAFGVYRAVVADLDDAARSRAWSEVHDCLTQFESGGGFAAEVELIVGSGARPG